MKIVTAEQMRSIDRRATENFGIPSIILMETAARAVADVIRTRFCEARRIAIFCGTGQNGGDGLAVARLLASQGVASEILLLGTPDRFRGDAQANLEICARLNLPLRWVADQASLTEAILHASQTALIVDAIFGTGLNRPAEGLHGDAIRAINALARTVISVDIPSGLNASSPEIHEPVVRADLTVTFAQLKIATVFDPAAACCGETIVADIGIPKAAVDEEEIGLSFSAPADFRKLVAPRAKSTHKGSYGHVGIIGGSEGRSGAAILAARGAVRGGAGLVTVITDHETARIVDTLSIESMSMAVDFRSADMNEFLEKIRKFTSLVIGPGLSDDEETYAFIRAALERIEQPAVIDATAINAYADGLATLNVSGGRRILTPHPGELARALKTDTSSINGNRIVSARRAAAVSKSVVVLKGHQTLIAEPRGNTAVNPTGNPGMATGGMGDVLSGLLGALIAREADLFLAARAGVFLHGLAADLLAAETSDIGLTAMDVADRLPAAVSRVRAQTHE